MIGVMGVKGVAWVPTALQCPPASPPQCCGGPGHRPALSPRSHGPHAPASRVSLNPGSPQATDAGGWGALERALAWRLSRQGWALGPGPLQSPLCSGMWSSQNLGGRPWQGLWRLLGVWSRRSEGLPHWSMSFLQLPFLPTVLSGSSPIPSHPGPLWASGLHFSNLPPWETFIN